MKQKPDLNIKNYEGDTVAMIAFKYCKDKHILLELLKQKPDLNYKNYDNNTVTIFAFIDCIDNEVLLELLKQKPDVTVKNFLNKTALDYALENYIKSPIFEFDVLEKLYDENCKQDKKLLNPKYIKLRNKYKVLPLILFRHQKRYGVKN
ncbi:MAG: hypothetical protein CMF62_04325 [Magnetococcales bacterium]|nr:hypothetical protein [Magnetococcales bacterium]